VPPALLLWADEVIQ